MGKLELSYYDASDGPRLMIFGPLIGSYVDLQEVFRRLSRGETDVELHLLPFILVHDDVQLVASCSGSLHDQLRGKPQGIRARSLMGGHRFEWVRTVEGWDYLAALIDALVKNPFPGHQYLSAYPKEDVIVVLSKGEYDERLRDY